MGNINIGYAFTISPNFCFKRVFIKKDYEASKKYFHYEKKKPTVYFYLLSKYSAKFAFQLNKISQIPIILVR